MLGLCPLRQGPMRKWWPELVVSAEALGGHPAVPGDTGTPPFADAFQYALCELHHAHLTYVLYVKYPRLHVLSVYILK